MLLQRSLLKWVERAPILAALAVCGVDPGGHVPVRAVRADETPPCEERCTEAKSRCVSACAERMDPAQCQSLCDNTIATCYHEGSERPRTWRHLGERQSHLRRWPRPPCPRVGPGGPAEGDHDPRLEGRRPGCQIGRPMRSDQGTVRIRRGGIAPDHKNEMIEATIEMKVPDLPYDGSEGTTLAFSLAGTNAIGPTDAHPRGGQRIRLPDAEFVSLAGSRSFSRDIDAWKRAFAGGEGNSKPYECRSVTTDRGSSPLAVGDVVTFNLAFSPGRDLAQLLAQPLKVDHELKSTCPAVQPLRETLDETLNAPLTQPSSYVLAERLPAMAAIGSVPGCSFVWKREASGYKGAAHCVRDGGKGYSENFTYAITFP
jgi:hypothetical protein